MEKTKDRTYNCKQEELSPIGRIVQSILRRDLSVFSAYSPVFNPEYVDTFGEKLNLVDELVTPKIETDELKKITKSLYKTMDDLVDPITKIRGYLTLTKNTVGLSAKEFGLIMLRRKIESKDAEGVLQNLAVVNAFLNKYREPLTVVGLNDDITEQFNVALVSIAENNKRQFEIVSNRKSIVLNNRNVLNDLNAQLSEILNIGKSLFRGKDALKVQEYTFSTLMKSVRHVNTKKKEEEKK
jgi:hypothetical protein